MFSTSFFHNNANLTFLSNFAGDHVKSKGAKTPFWIPSLQLNISLLFFIFWKLLHCCLGMQGIHRVCRVLLFLMTPPSSPPKLVIQGSLWTMGWIAQMGTVHRPEVTGLSHILAKTLFALFKFVFSFKFNCLFTYKWNQMKQKLLMIEIKQIKVAYLSLLNGRLGLSNTHYSYVNLN